MEPQSSAPVETPAPNQSQPHQSWWCGEASNESELLNAAVLCTAIAAVVSSSSNETTGERDAGWLRELERHVRLSALPHSLLFPVVQANKNMVLVESAQSVICAVHATTTNDIVSTVLGSTVPLSEPYVYRFGGARIHLPFWKRAQRMDVQSAYRLAKRKRKTLLLCGHSIGGSIAQLALCELVYQQIPPSLRKQLEQLDVEQKKNDKTQASAGSSNNSRSTQSNALTIADQWHQLETVTQQVMAVGFGSPYISSRELASYLAVMRLTRRVVTFVNEFDCIPGILNVAQSAAMVTRTTERFYAITKATTTLLNLLPAQMQQCLMGTAAAAATTEGAAAFAVPSAASAYVAMSLNILQNTFQKFRDHNVIKAIDYQYAPCGTYIFLKRDGSAFQVFSRPEDILQNLHEEGDAAASLTGNSILQHLMSAYIDAIAKRSTSIQINASMNFYERLNVPQNASPRQIRTAYKALALKWHPDRWAQASVQPRERETAEQVFKLLAESYEVLSDPEARKEYDEHLARAPSITEEFVRQGTVNGMSLDEAIATFRNVIDGVKGTMANVSSRFSSSSSSSVVGQPIRRVAAANTQSNGLVINNHDNLFAPDRIRIARKVGGMGTEQQDQIMYLQPDDILPGDVAAPTQNLPAKTGGATGMRTVSVVGGAIVVGASVALLVNAWSQYSDSAKRKRQAEAVRNMPGEHLLLLMSDHRSSQQDSSQLLQNLTNIPSTITVTHYTTEQAKEAEVGSSSYDLAVTSAQAMIAKQRQEEDQLVDEFFDCVAEYDNAQIEALAEEEFFDCLDVAESVALYFEEANQTTNENQGELENESPEIVLFPEGSSVLTPYGLGKVLDWRPDSSSAVVRLDGSKSIAYIQKSDLSRGAIVALWEATESVETNRLALAERVLVQYGLDDSPSKSTIRSLIEASKDGALDSGLRAAGGVALAKGISRTSAVLGRAGAAAPLTIASILVDIGKEYYDYRQKHSERKTLGVLSDASERLMMKDFRLKAGQHIASGTAAAAGAGLGAYGVASAVGFWTGVGIAGPVGVVAATGAAVVGGMLGFFAGTKAYNGYTASYFESHAHAKEHIDRLELGARIMFNEYDPEGEGEISKEDCIKIMTKLYEASGAVSEHGYQGAVAILEDENFEGPMTWSLFWAWVSTEAAKSLQKLELVQAGETDTNSPSSAKSGVTATTGSWWSSYLLYFSYANSAPVIELAMPNESMYPAVWKTLMFTQSAAAAEAENESTIIVEQEVTVADEMASLVILRAQVETLVNIGALTENDAFQLEQLLESSDEELRDSARKTIEMMHEGQTDVEASRSAFVIAEGFSGEVSESAEDKDSASMPSVTLTRDTRRKAPVDARKPAAILRRSKTKQEAKEQLDVLCSLLSTPGLRQFLEANNMLPAESAAHEDLHLLALTAANAASEPSP